jgi:perosamine synthetase
MERGLRAVTDAPFYEPLDIPLARPWLDDEEPAAAAQVVRSGMLCQGAQTAAFEEAFAHTVGARHAIAVSSGSTALLVALQAMGVRQGDEVIVPDMTFVSTATSAVYLGARPVLCDITLRDYNMDASRAEGLITARTKALIPVHYAGQTADMDPLRQLARRHGLLILEDAAEAHLARYAGERFAGTIGDIGIFSFTPTKPMTTGEGGMIVTDDDDLARQCRLIRNFGDGGKFAWHALGFNFRLNEVAAAVGLCQLAKLPEIVAMRREKARRYDAAFAAEDAIVTPVVRGPEDTNYQLYTVLLRLEALKVGRDRVIAELAQRGISSRLYYPALHRMKVFADLEQNHDRCFPNAVIFERSALSLPIFTGLQREEQDRVIDALIEVVRAHRR